MGSAFAKIQKKAGKRSCCIISIIGLAGALPFLIMSTSNFLDDYFVKEFCAFIAFCDFIIGTVFLAAALHDSDRDKGAAVGLKPLRFFTVNQGGDIILAEVSAPPPLDCTEMCREDGKVDISVGLHSKEQAVKVLAALAIMYEKGDIAAADYHCNVHKIREHFNL